MSFECVDFCGDFKHILPQLGASRRMERQPAKCCESRRVGSKSLTIKYMLGDTLEPL